MSTYSELNCGPVLPWHYKPSPVKASAEYVLEKFGWPLNQRSVADLEWPRSRRRQIKSPVSDLVNWP
ncbi:hypothetical protein AG1IA_00365 [Rhizoctonia solani AG-1 IA]|uniref:Uncharacterized protein n=1 Tax=Thanatephorus cucumeris (strain AG1-IA) TaxID=983506 RepID=L8X5X4_THACA|nr:hypothetical protein AG1IA_00365 [Rhizoctonia solani AG-1 IA]